MNGKAVEIRHCPATVSDGEGPQKATVPAGRDGKARAGKRPPASFRRKSGDRFDGFPVPSFEGERRT